MCNFCLSVAAYLPLLSPIFLFLAPSHLSYLSFSCPLPPLLPVFFLPPPTSLTFLFLAPSHLSYLSFSCPLPPLLPVFFLPPPTALTFLFLSILTRFLPVFLPLFLPLLSLSVARTSAQSAQMFYG